MAQRTTSKYELMPVNDVIGVIQEYTRVLPSHQVDLADALGAVLAEDVVAADDLPPFPASIKVQILTYRRHAVMPRSKAAHISCTEGRHVETCTVSALPM